MGKLLLLLILQLVGVVVASPRPVAGQECTYAYYWTDQITLAKTPGGRKPFACVNPIRFKGRTTRTVHIEIPGSWFLGYWLGVGAVEASGVGESNGVGFMDRPVACLAKGYVDGQYGLCGRCEDLRTWAAFHAKDALLTTAHQMTLCRLD